MSTEFTTPILQAGDPANRFDSAPAPFGNLPPPALSSLWQAACFGQSNQDAHQLNLRRKSEMYNGLEIIDFHVHFPTRQGSFIEGGPNPRQEYAQRVGERRATVAREQAMNYNRQWRATWGFDPPRAQELQRRGTGGPLGGGDREIRLARGRFRDWRRQPESGQDHPAASG